MNKARYAWLALALVGCVDGRDEPVTSGGTMVPPFIGRGSPSAGDGQGGDGTGGGGGAPDVVCETLAGCEQCSACAVQGPCAARAASCQVDPGCRAALDCLQACESGCNFDDPMCTQQCSVNCNDGTGATQQAASLIDCVCDLTCGCAPEERGACATGLILGPT